MPTEALAVRREGVRQLIFRALDFLAGRGIPDDHGAVAMVSSARDESPVRRNRHGDCAAKSLKGALFFAALRVPKADATVGTRCSDQSALPIEGYALNTILVLDRKKLLARFHIPEAKCAISTIEAAC